MSETDCPKCESSATQVAGGKNEFRTYRCDECDYEFKLPPIPELTPPPPSFRR